MLKTIQLKFLFSLFFLLFNLNGNAQYLPVDWANGLFKSMLGKATPTDLYADENANIYIVGYFSGSIDFDPDPDNYEFESSNGLDDIFIAKYSKDGKYLWSLSAGSSENDWANSIAADKYGNFYITGYFSGTFRYDENKDPLTSVGREDILFLEFDKNGKIKKTLNFGGTGSDVGNSIKIDNDNDIILAGTFESSFSFGSEELVSLTSNGKKDIFLAKISQDNSIYWATNLGTKEDDQAFKIGIDNARNIYLAGRIKGDLIFGKEIKVELDPVFETDLSVAKFSSFGEIIRLNRIGTSGADFISDIAVNDDDNLYVTGAFFKKILVKSKTKDQQLNSSGLSDAFFIHYNKEGNLVKASSFGGIGEDFGQAVKIMDDGQVIFSGIFADSASFSSNVCDLTLGSNQSELLFHAKFNNKGSLKMGKKIPVNNVEQYGYDNGLKNKEILAKFSLIGQKSEDSLLAKIKEQSGKRQSSEIVILNWITSNEKNNPGFDIERKLEGSEEFSKVGFANAYGSTSITTNYLFNDTNPFDGLSFYRFSQSDSLGNTYYSDEFSVPGLTKPKPGLFTIYPMPVKTRLNIRFGNIPKEVKTAKIVISTFEKEPVFEFDAGIVSRELLEVDEVKSLKKGRYLITVEYNTGVKLTQEFLKE